MSDLVQLLQMLTDSAGTLNFGQILPQPQVPEILPADTPTASSSGLSLPNPNSRSSDEIIQAPEWTVQDYFATGKKTNPAKRRFRHILKKAAVEAEIWGDGTFKDLVPSRLKHIHDRVYSQCPILKDHEREVDEVLAKSLIEAKHYMKRKGKQCTIEKKLKKKKARKGKRQISKSSSSGDSDSDLKGMSRIKGSHGVKRKPKNQQQHQQSTSEDSDSQPKSMKLKDKSSKSTKGKLKACRPRVGESRFESSDESDTSTKRKGKNKESKTLKKSKKMLMPKSKDFRSGQSIVIKYHDQNLATGTFLEFQDDVYAKLMFEDHLIEDPSQQVIELPQEIRGHNEVKMNFHELERGDIFLWKSERLSQNSPNAGYVLGIPPQKDIFSSTSHTTGKRVPKPKQRINL